MSVVCVKKYDDKIVFAADSIAVINDTKLQMANLTKLEQINNMIVGGAGSSEELNLLFLFSQTHSPLSATEKDIMTFFYEFYKWKVELELPFASENEYIIGYNKKAFFIQGLLVNEVLDYHAIGAGMDYALAALYLGHSPEDAVKVACDLNCYVAEPIVTKTIKL